MTYLERIARTLCVAREGDADHWIDYVGEAHTVALDLDLAGFVIVPREPTNKMIGAYISCLQHSARGRDVAAKDKMGMHVGKARVRWAAMLNAYRKMLPPPERGA